MYDSVKDKWHDLHTNQSKVPCQHEKASKFSSALLKPANYVIVAVNNCTAALNLASYIWTKFPLPMANGVTFNIDSEEEIVLYIASKEEEQFSHIYWVN